MQPDFIKGSVPLEVAWAAAILVISVVFAWLVIVAMRYIQHKLEQRTRKSALLPQLLNSFARPLLLLIIVEGLILALGSLSLMAQWSDSLSKAGIGVLIACVTYAVANSGGAILAWYLRKTTVRRKARVDEGLIRFLRRIMVLIIFAIGVLIILEYLNISITPVIAGLGIGGLAVALALQPTLANFFASTQIISDRLVRVGDYIELDNGTIRGYVADVGWRSTRIRTPFNNLVIIPNSRLADSVITNYFGPTMEMGVIVECGVSYNADLPKVETVSLEVATEVIEELDEADKEFEPWFGYDEFGDSNINFWIWLRAKDRLASFRVKSEIIKRLKARLDREGININYPARLHTFEKSDSLPFFLTGRQDSKNPGERKK